MVSDGVARTPTRDRRLLIRPARIGLGAFAAKTFRQHEDIIRIAGRIVAADLLWKRGGTFADNCFRFGPETYLDPGDEPCRYLNHGCEPNAGIRKINNQLFLFAAKPIRKGAEIVFDYSTLLGDDDIWTMRCKCRHAKCRKLIRRFGSLPEALKTRYVSKGMVPQYIIRTLEKQLNA